MIFLFRGKVPRFAKRYAEIEKLAIEATERFVSDVKSLEYPAQNSYAMKDGEYDRRTLAGEVREQGND
ncbi:hypothetical protein MASR1M66_03600 [Aminivibrio sp.]